MTIMRFSYNFVNICKQVLVVACLAKLVVGML